MGHRASVKLPRLTPATGVSKHKRADFADGSGDEITGQWCTPHWPAHGGYTSELRPGMFGGSPNATLDTPLKKAAVGAGILAILGSGLYIASKRGAIPGMGSMAEGERKNIPWWLVGGLTVLAAGDAVTPGFPFPGSAILMVPLAGAAWVAKASQYGVARSSHCDRPGSRFLQHGEQGQRDLRRDLHRPASPSRGQEVRLQGS